jgi:bifunctional DNA-binding transcriptional regulator/antitoxin component of YhaV-PrlF toxin-antitoxin module
MPETLYVEEGGKVTLPITAQTRYGFKPKVAVRVIETQSGLLLVPLTDDPMCEALQEELSEWQALGAERACLLFLMRNYSRESRRAFFGRAGFSTYCHR